MTDGCSQTEVMEQCVWNGHIQNERVKTQRKSHSGSNTAGVNYGTIQHDGILCLRKMFVEKKSDQILLHHNCTGAPIYWTGLQHTSLRIVYFLLGISPASNCSWPTFQNPVSVPSSKAGCTV